LSFEIGKVLETNEPFHLKIKDVVASRTYIASETRMGKSYTTRKIVENVYGHVPIIIIDPEGEYSSLREKYSFVIIGKDVPLEVETAEFMAEWVLKENVSVIIDTSMIKDDKEYVDSFLNQFFYRETTSRKPYLIIIEEAEDYAAEKGAPGTFLGITAVLARKGGKRGIGVIYVGHRPAWISKGVLSQCPNKAVGKIESTDFEALEKFARIAPEIVEKLPDLNKGEFCLSGDWVDEPTFIKVGQVKTTHLGASPDTVPSSPKELQAVIEGLRKSLPEVISKAKAAVTPISEIKTKMESEIKSKYDNKIETVLKTADEKAERKYKVKIEELQNEVDKLSRAQSLQPTMPITDALEHPIVKARMLKLDDKSRDLLTLIEHDPGRTREELAAKMITSKDAIANMVNKINSVFQLQVIVDDKGRPLRYKSMLKRLFLTDVGRKEIDELKRLQDRNRTLEEENNNLRPAAQHSTALHSEVQRLTTELAKKTSENTSLQTICTSLKTQTEALIKENDAFKKIKEGFAVLGVMTPTGVDEQKLKAMINTAIANLPRGAGTPSQISKEEFESLKEEVNRLNKSSHDTTQGPDGILVSTSQPKLTLEKEIGTLKLTNKDVRGRLAILYAEGLLPSEKSFTMTDLARLSASRFGTQEANVHLKTALIEFVNWGYLITVQAGKRTDYKVKMSPEEAREKGLIHEAEIHVDK
jgi:hypothetical protein